MDKKLINLSKAEFRTREFARGKYLFPDTPEESKDGMANSVIWARKQKNHRLLADY